MGSSLELWLRNANSHPEFLDAAMPGRYVMLAIGDTVRGWTSSCKPALRTVLYAQGIGQGHGPRLVHLRRHCQAERGLVQIALPLYVTLCNEATTRSDPNVSSKRENRGSSISVNLSFLTLRFRH